MADKTQNVKTRLSFDGEAEYKAACKEINSTLKVLNSEMKLVTAEYKDNASSVDALKAKQTVLQKTYDEQQIYFFESGQSRADMIAHGHHSQVRAEGEQPYTDNQRDCRYYKSNQFGVCKIYEGGKVKNNDYQRDRKNRNQRLFEFSEQRRKHAFYLLQEYLLYL